MHPLAGKTCMSYWLPKIEAAGLPSPRTILLTMPAEAQESIWSAFDGKEGGNIDPFIADLTAAAETIGYPCFLRTGHTSHKHAWKDACYLQSSDSIGQHVFDLAEFSELCDFMGLPWDVWAVRELLPTKPAGYCVGYGGMPICREFRFFVDEDKVRCWHPYWPKFAPDDGAPAFVGDFDYDTFCRLDDPEPLKAIASAAGRVLGGSWSVDMLETERGWFLTDMAEAERSFHWPSCLAGQPQETA